MKIEQPSYYAIIPASVRYCKQLPPAAKLLYGEITALASTDRGCFARNKYFAELFDVDVRTTSRWMNLLEQLNFIVREESSSENGLRKIYLKNHDVPEKSGRKLESYQEIMDSCFAEKELQRSLWNFIRHCQLNGRMLTNDKLMDIIVRLDMNYGSDESSKIASIEKAISKGYFDIAEE